MAFSISFVVTQNFGRGTEIGGEFKFVRGFKFLSGTLKTLLKWSCNRSAIAFGSVNKSEFESTRMLGEDNAFLWRFAYLKKYLESVIILLIATFSSAFFSVKKESFCS